MSAKRLLTTCERLERRAAARTRGAAAAVHALECEHDRARAAVIAARSGAARQERLSSSTCAALHLRSVRGALEQQRLHLGIVAARRSLAGCERERGLWARYVRGLRRRCERAEAQEQQAWAG